MAARQADANGVFSTSLIGHCRAWSRECDHWVYSSDVSKLAQELRPGKRFRQGLSGDQAVQSRGGSAAGADQATASPGDPRYLDAAYWPTPQPGQSSIAARLEQCAAIDLHLREQRRRARKSRPRQVRLGTPSQFRELVPWRPYAADQYEDGVYKKPRQVALSMRYLQVNSSRSVGWLLFDVDRSDAFEAAEQAGLPEPTFAAINPSNGHGHLGWLLKSPVPRYDTADRKPIEFLAAVERGMLRRLNADRSYPRLLVKNPISPAWSTQWRSPMPFTLEDLNANLTTADKRRELIAHEVGEGRNCTVFEILRKRAYQDVRTFFDAPEDFCAHLLCVGIETNHQFEAPLSQKEVAVICRSVAKWTLAHFTPQRFAEIQRARAQKRWADHVAASSEKPWEAEGISRRMYYYRRASSV